MTEILPISQLGNPILRQQAQLIENVHNEHIQNLIDDLIATATASNGVGIAAPQTAQSYRLFIVASRPNPRYPTAPKMEPTAMINPKIIAHSSQVVKGWEGCLSIPGIRGLVPRYQTIEVEYTNHDIWELNRESLEYSNNLPSLWLPGMNEQWFFGLIMAVGSIFGAVDTWD